MKRALHVVGEPTDRAPSEPICVRFDGRVLSVADAHDGTVAERFVSYLKDAGGTEVYGAAEADFRIVIRSTPQSLEARSRAEVIEQTADLVLGSVRPVVARQLALRASSRNKQ